MEPHQTTETSQTAVATGRYPAKPVGCTCRLVEHDPTKETLVKEGDEYTEPIVEGKTTDERGTTITHLRPTFCECQWAEFCYKDCPCGCCRYYYADDFDSLGREIATLDDLELLESPVVMLSRETIGPLVGGWRKQVVRIVDAIKSALPTGFWTEELMQMADDMEEFEKTEEVVNMRPGEPRPDPMQDGKQATLPEN